VAHGTYRGTEATLSAHFGPSAGGTPGSLSAGSGDAVPVACAPQHRGLDTLSKQTEPVGEENSKDAQHETERDASTSNLRDHRNTVLKLTGVYPYAALNSSRIFL
jgi:hypothetical protein